MIMKKWLLSLMFAFGLLGVFSHAHQVLAADTISNSTFRDDDLNGTVERIRWVMDENVTACAYEAGDWSVAVAGDLNVTITGLSCSGLDANLYILVTADAQETGAFSTVSSISYADAGTSGSVTLTSGNMGAHTGVLAADGANPRVIVSGTYAPWYDDLDEDGKIDRIVFWLTEFVTLGSVLSRNSISIVNAGDFTGFSSDATTTDLIVSQTSTVSISNLVESSAVDTYDDSGNLELAFQNTYSLTDLAANTTTSLSNITTLTDAAEAVIVSSEYLDSTGNDGKIDAFTFTLSETISSTSSIAAEDFSVTTAGDFTGIAFGSSSTDLVTINANTITVPLGTAATATDTREGSATLAMTVPGTFSIVNLDLVSATALHFSTIHTFIDGASPVISSISPADGATGSSPSTNIVITFSEAMDGAFAEGVEYTVTPDPGSFVGTWSNTDQTITLDPASTLAINTSYAVALSSGAITDELGGDTLNVAGTLDGTWSFTTGTGASGSSGYTAPVIQTYLIDLTTPIENQILTTGQNLELQWTTSGTGAVSVVDLSYSADNGTTWVMIADNTNNDGSTFWTVPALAAGSSIIVRAEATDTIVILASDTSPSVTVGTIVTTPPPVTSPIIVSAPVLPDGFGLSPVTGLQESLSQVVVGQYIKGTSLPTVYYLDPNGTRRPFLSEQVYFTWATSFNQVITVTDATLPTIPVGTPVIPRPRVVLVKIVSSTKVYAVEPADATSTKGILRWIPTESIATSVYGADWADYVIDIPSTIISRYTYGEDLTASDTRPAGMKKRSALHN